MLKSFLTTLTLTLAVTATAAQADDITRYRGTIEKVDGTAVTIKPRVGEALTVSMAPDVKVLAASTGKITDIKPDSYIGTAAIPQPDGSQKALQVTVFASSLRGTADGHYPWDLGSNSTMTNGAIGTISGTEGRTLLVKYQGGEKKVNVPDDVPVTLVDPGDKSIVVDGAKVVAFTKKGTDGKPTAVILIVGRNGTVPSM
ncbi:MULTISPECIES: hypothetical protein [Methylobacterium]|jgi:hypothetical protein|uniref:DUF5666 domain-containing protein n=1 Tax=Methylobacterium bullatum TaxID=570505 RepID=A0A679JGZ4_9HYPH|nr:MULTISPECIES: hypothetical protein [Methylobacterium]MBD8903225.1 hypothetical protein [Methylobacterium bullatum]TXN24385.1 hypothetical protein FV220_20240 [Methylobacterium sp. WL19]GJD40397.1 hypothetical protein OICFNHDK_2867 [Methylobacterium bullatum]CAA2136624.1 hypothetical protein MBLL_00257 [Methylobacterium bullatum]